MNGKRRLLFYSQYAFLESLYAVFKQVCADFGLDGFVITHEGVQVPKVYAPLGYLTHECAGLEAIPNSITVIPKELPIASKSALLRSKIRDINPDFLWAHEEPTNLFVNQILRWYYLRRSPKIVVAAVENLWPEASNYRQLLSRFCRTQLWRRYDGVLASATKSIEAIQRFGMPLSVPTRTAWLPHLVPPPISNHRDASFLPKKKQSEVFVGFAGRISDAKGWRVLLAAMTQLPESFKCLIAGTGEEEAELRLWCLLPALRDRIQYLGVLDKAKLWDMYRSLDVFVLPSLTTSGWAEQFGSVIAEAMSCGVPVIGSSSGAIPEVVGDCGIIVSEGDSTALAEAIWILVGDPLLRATSVDKGLLRFEQEFSLRAYAAKLGAAFGLKTWAEPTVPAKRVEAKSDLKSHPVYTPFQS